MYERDGLQRYFIRKHHQYHAARQRLRCPHSNCVSVWFDGLLSIPIRSVDAFEMLTIDCRLDLSAFTSRRAVPPSRLPGLPLRWWCSLRAASKHIDGHSSDDPSFDRSNFGQFRCCPEPSARDQIRYSCSGSHSAFSRANVRKRAGPRVISETGVRSLNNMLGCQWLDAFHLHKDKIVDGIKHAESCITSRQYLLQRMGFVER
jgi:hypothetical protein